MKQIQYQENRPVDSEALTALYLDSGWTNYTDKKDVMEGLLSHSLWHAAACDGEELVGLIRVVGDDLSICYIQDLLVRSDRRRQGIASALIERALKRFSHVRQTVLLTDAGSEAVLLYQKLGFITAESCGCQSFLLFR